MGTHNSLAASRELNFYERLFLVSYSDVADVSAIPRREFLRDVAEMRRRVAHEGLGFLTKTLPSLRKSIDKALATGSSLQWSGFQKNPRHSTPLFLGWLIRQIFDANGCERSDASAGALGCVRQLTDLFYKLETPLDETQSDEVIRSFKETEKEIDSRESLQPSSADAWITRKAKTLIARVLAPVDPLGTDFVPKHGPGAVATGEKPWEKPLFKRYYSKLAKVFPYEKYFYYNLTHLCDELQAFLDLEDLTAGTAKVVLVPKDSRGPRLISCEPLEYQWIQQGLMTIMVKTIESCPLTRGFVNFTCQEVNRRLALEASKGAPWVTLDMKEASDRVSLSLVEQLFPPNWVEALKASRTESTRLPSGEVVHLKKFAPMGSAVCFPVEALVFWALSVASILHKHPDWKTGQVPVYVYGDDLIVRTEDHGILLQQLPKFGLMFNDGKCCTHGSFRESCGCDAYKGVDITPLRIRKMWGHRFAGTNYVSWVEYRNSFLERGYVKTCDFLTEEIQLRRKTPYSDNREHSTVAFYDVRKKAYQENIRLRFRRRYNSRLQRYEWYTWQVRPRLYKTGTPGWAEMQRIASHWRSGQDLRLAPDAKVSSPRFVRSVVEMDALVTACQYTVPRAVTLTRGWGTL